MRRVFVLVLLTIGVGFAPQIAMRGSAQRTTESARPRQASTPPRTATPAPSGTFDTVVKPFVAQNCVTCHGNKKQEKGLNLQSFETAASLVEHGDRWEDVIGKLRGKEMPPIEEEQPEEEDRQAVAAWLEAELQRIERTTPPDPGRVTARRLNRNEYNNTIRELLGVDVRPADDFPQDDSGYGFDNIADVLSLSPVLMEKYVAAADRVARMALFGPPRMSPTLVRLRSEGRRVQELRSVPEAYDTTGLSLPNAFHAIHRVPVDGEYVVRVVLGGLRPKTSMPVTIALWVDEKQLQTTTHDQEQAASFSDDRQDFGGQAVQFRVRLAAGDHWLSVAIPRIYEGLPARYNGPNPSTRPDTPREFRPPANAPPERLALLKKRFEEAGAELVKIPLNGVRVNAVEVGGPYAYVKGPSKRERAEDLHLRAPHGRAPADVRAAHHHELCATGVPAAGDGARDGEVRRAGASGRRRKRARSTKGSRSACRRSSSRPTFSSGSSAIGRRPARRRRCGSRRTNWRRGSRTSSGRACPTQTLRRAADTGTLRDPKVLAYQVRRMLRDPKSRALAENFGGQWLQFRALESLTRDREKFPDFEDYLRLSMRRETELFVDHVVRTIAACSTSSTAATRS